MGFVLQRTQNTEGKVENGVNQQCFPFLIPFSTHHLLCKDCKKNVFDKGINTDNRGANII